MKKISSSRSEVIRVKCIRDAMSYLARTKYYLTYDDGEKVGVDVALFISREYLKDNGYDFSDNGVSNLWGDINSDVFNELVNVDWLAKDENDRIYKIKLVIKGEDCRLAQEYLEAVVK